MAGTYKAVEVSTPGKLRVVERPVSEPWSRSSSNSGEACGICHTDYGHGHRSRKLIGGGADRGKLDSTYLWCARLKAL